MKRGNTGVSTVCTQVYVRFAGVVPIDVVVVPLLFSKDCFYFQRKCGLESSSSSLCSRGYAHRSRRTRTNTAAPFVAV